MTTLTEWTTEAGPVFTVTRQTIRYADLLLDDVHGRLDAAEMDAIYRAVSSVSGIEEIGNRGTTWGTYRD